MPDDDTRDDTGRCETVPLTGLAAVNWGVVLKVATLAVTAIAATAVLLYTVKGHSDQIEEHEDKAAVTDQRVRLVEIRMGKVEDAVVQVGANVKTIQTDIGAMKEDKVKALADENKRLRRELRRRTR